MQCIVFLHSSSSISVPVNFGTHLLKKQRQNNSNNKTTVFIFISHPTLHACVWEALAHTFYFVYPFFLVLLSSSTTEFTRKPPQGNSALVHTTLILHSYSILPVSLSTLSDHPMVIACVPLFANTHIHTLIFSVIALLLSTHCYCTHTNSKLRINSCKLNWRQRCVCEPIKSIKLIIVLVCV